MDRFNKILFRFPIIAMEGKIRNAVAHQKNGLSFAEACKPQILFPVRHGVKISLTAEIAVFRQRSGILSAAVQRQSRAVPDMKKHSPPAVINKTDQRGRKIVKVFFAFRSVETVQHGFLPRDFDGSFNRRPDFGKIGIFKQIDDRIADKARPDFAEFGRTGAVGDRGYDIPSSTA